jgi:hypothetical protein
MRLRRRAEDCADRTKQRRRCVPTAMVAAAAILISALSTASSSVATSVAQADEGAAQKEVERAARGIVRTPNRHDAQVTPLRHRHHR